MRFQPIRAKPFFPLLPSSFCTAGRPRFHCVKRDVHSLPIAGAFPKVPAQLGISSTKKQAAPQGAACLSIFFPKWGNAEGLAAAGAGDLPLRPTHLVGPPATSPAKRRGRRWRGPRAPRGAGDRLPPSIAVAAHANGRAAGWSRVCNTRESRRGISPSAAVVGRLFPLLWGFSSPPRCPLGRTEGNSA